MAQLFLDGTQIGAIGQQVRGVGMAKAVGMHRGIAGQRCGVEFYDESDAPIEQPAAAMIDK